MRPYSHTHTKKDRRTAGPLDQIKPAGSEVHYRAGEGAGDPLDSLDPGDDELA
jgi:hypothetical protein